MFPRIHPTQRLRYWINRNAEAPLGRLAVCEFALPSRSQPVGSQDRHHNDSFAGCVSRHQGCSHGSRHGHMLGTVSVSPASHKPPGPVVASVRVLSDPTLCVVSMRGARKNVQRAGVLASTAATGLHVCVSVLLGTTVFRVVLSCSGLERRLWLQLSEP